MTLEILPMATRSEHKLENDKATHFRFAPGTNSLRRFILHHTNHARTEWIDKWLLLSLDLFQTFIVISLAH